MNDAETILRAAELIEQRAQAVIAADGGEWVAAGDITDVTLSTADCTHIAGMSPTFARAVAEWLRSAARVYGRVSAVEGGEYGHALAIARAYLAGQA